MVKLIFEFDKKLLEELEATEDDLLYKVRFYANENGITESSLGVFEKDGEDALCLLTTLVTDVVCENIVFLGFLLNLILDVDGEKEDCIESIEENYREKGLVEEDSSLDNYFKERRARKQRMKFNLTIDEFQWNYISEKGYPEEDEWCHIIYRDYNGGFSYFVGGYNPHEKEFWVSFGIGGAVVDEKDVIAWAPFEENYLKVYEG